MQTLLEVLQKSERFFADKGLEKPKLDAEFLISEALGYSRLEMYLHYDRPLEEEKLALLRPLIKRRAAREPLQYILGNVDFLDMKLKVDSRALIPRPETEELAEWLVAQWTDKPPVSVLDLGTGSGALALALAQSWQGAQVCGVDASEEALALARENAAMNGLERVNWLRSDWFSQVKGTYDLIVSNPPYLTEAEWGSAAPEVRDFEPKQALLSEDEGMADLKAIIQHARVFMKAEGWLVLETGIAQHERLEIVARECGFEHVESRMDLSERSRFLIIRNG